MKCYCNHSPCQHDGHLETINAPTIVRELVTRNNVRVGDKLTIDRNPKAIAVVSEVCGFGLKVDIDRSMRVPFTFEEIIRRNAMIVGRAS